MKKNIKIIATAVVIGGLIFSFLLGTPPSTFSLEKSEPNSEKILELMGTETSFGVKGNCGMCKKTIETAAMSLEGVINADWDVNTKQVSLVYDSQIIDLMSIHKVIAGSGYGTELVENNMDSYENLPLCCKYDPNMNVKSN